MEAKLKTQEDEDGTARLESKVRRMEEVLASERCELARLKASTTTARWGHGNSGDPHIVLRCYGRERNDLKQAESGLDTWCDCEKLHKLYDDGHEPCCGDNGMVMFRTACHPEFWWIVKHFYSSVRHLLGPDGRAEEAYGRAHVHGLRCKHAKHRSRSSMNLLRAVLESLGFVVDCETYGPWSKCRCPGACPNLTRTKSAQYEKAGATAIQLTLRFWEEISSAK